MGQKRWGKINYCKVIGRFVAGRNEEAKEAKHRKMAVVRHVGCLL